MSDDIADWLNLHIEQAEQKLIMEFINDLKESDNILYQMEGINEFNHDLIEKWEGKRT